MSSRYRDRVDAGEQLAARLAQYAGDREVLVLALPRGGVPVGYAVARALRAELDICVVRKLGVPGQEELAFGAIASGGVRVLNEDVVASLGITGGEIEAVVAREAQELARRERRYRDGRPAARVRGRVVILVDDGLATGATMRAAALAARAQAPRRLVVAVPVGAAESCEALRPLVDDLICARRPEPFYAVGLWYDDFGQTGDADVRALLARSSRERAGRAGGAGERAGANHADDDGGGGGAGSGDPADGGER